MHDERDSPVAQDEHRIEAAILRLLLDDESHRPWSEDELVREMGGPEGRINVLDALMRLYRAGLIHTFNGFVFATRAAVRGAQLAE